MATSVKISQLGNIGNNISGNSLIPIVDVTGVSTTDKVNVANLGNFILGQAGNTLNAAFLSNLAYSVANAAQPNITSVGNLTNLTVVGATDLGAVGNVTIIGGLVGQVLSTDGAGGLSWVNQSGGGGGNIGNITFNGANISTDLADTDIQIISNGTGGVQISTADEQATWTFDGNGTLTLPNDANIATIGNVTQFNTCTNGFLGLNSYDANGNSIARLNIDSIDGIVNISLSNPVTEIDYNWAFGNSGVTIFPTLTVDLHNGGNQSAQTLQFGDPTQQVVITGPTPEPNNNAQRIIIQGQRGKGTGEGGDVYVWAGDADINGGDIKIYAGDADNVTTGYGGYINLDGGTGFDGGGQINITGGSSSNGPGGGVSIQTGSGDHTSNITIQPGYSSGANYAGGGIVLEGGYSQGNDGGAVTVKGGQSGLGLANYGNVLVQAGANTWTFDNAGVVSAYGNFKLAPDSTNTGSYLDIFLTSGPDLHLVASAAANLILGKDNQANVMTSWNGNVTIQSWDINTDTQGGVWTFDGNNNLTAPGAINVGNMSIGALPGYITADANTGIILNTSGSDGGFVVDYLKEDGNANTSGGELAFSSELGNTTYRISLSDDLGNGFATKIWRFDGTGNLSLPSGGSVYSEGLTPSGNPGNTIILQPSGSGTITNQKLLVYPTAGDGDHIHMTSGNLYQTELFLGSDNLFVKLANTGNIVINSNDNVGNTAQWTFDTTGNLTLPELSKISDESIIGTSLTVGVPPTTILISGADFSAVNTTYFRDLGETIPTWFPAGYNPSTDPYIEFSSGQYGIWNPGFGQALYINTGTFNKPLPQWNINPPLGSVAPIGTYTYGDTGPVWTFDPDSTLTAPGNIITGTTGGRFMQDCSNSYSSMRWINITEGADTELIRAYTGNFIAPSSAIERGQITLNWGPASAQSGLTLISFDQDTAVQHEWIFSGDGNLTLPGNLFISGNSNVFGTDAALIQPNPDLPLISVTSGANGALATTWIEDIGNIGSSNIAAVYANPIPGSGIVRIAVGQNGFPGPNLWDFGPNGALTLPNNITIKTNSDSAIAIGAFANTGSSSAISIGTSAGNTNQSFDAIAIGGLAGSNSQSGTAIAIGAQAGANTQGIGAIALGTFAGNDSQGESAIAIGSGAGQTQQGNNSIILNASGSTLDQTTANTFTVAPVRNDISNIANVMFYNSSSKEITYSNTISVAGNITGGNIITAGSGGDITLTGGNINGAKIIVTTPTTLSSLTAIAGGRAFVNNANLVAVGNFGAQVGAGGSNTVPVWSDGTNWYIG